MACRSAVLARSTTPAAEGVLLFLLAALHQNSKVQQMPYKLAVQPSSSAEEYLLTRPEWARSMMHTVTAVLSCMLGNNWCAVAVSGDCEACSVAQCLPGAAGLAAGGCRHAGQG